MAECAAPVVAGHGAVGHLAQQAVAVVSGYVVDPVGGSLLSKVPGAGYDVALGEAWGLELAVVAAGGLLTIHPCGENQGMRSAEGADGGFFGASAAIDGRNLGGERFLAQFGLLRLGIVAGVNTIPVPLQYGAP